MHLFSYFFAYNCLPLAPNGQNWPGGQYAAAMHVVGGICPKFKNVFCNATERRWNLPGQSPKPKILGLENSRNIFGFDGSERFTEKFCGLEIQHLHIIFERLKNSNLKLISCFLISLFVTPNLNSITRPIRLQQLKLALIIYLNFWGFQSTKQICRYFCHKAYATCVLRRPRGNWGCRPKDNWLFLRRPSGGKCRPSETVGRRAVGLMECNCTHFLRLLMRIHIF